MRSWWWPLLLPLHLVSGTITADTQQLCPLPTVQNTLSLLASCPLHSQSGAETDPISNEPPGWLRGDDCTDVASTAFCAFTNPDFNDGLGISVITTAPRLQTLASLPALSNPTAAKKPWRDAGPPFRDEEIAGKGIGLVATRRIITGEMILARTPAVMVDDEGFKGLSEAALGKLLVQAVVRLPMKHQAQYMNLSTHVEVGGEEERVFQVFARNNYRVRIANMTDFHATFVDGQYMSRCQCVTISMKISLTLPHSFPYEPRLSPQLRLPVRCHIILSKGLCSSRYSARRGVDARLHRVSLTSYLDLAMPLTASSSSPIQTREKRRGQLEESWGFTCSCEHCAAEDAEVAASDERVERIHQLWKELDDYTEESPATPEKGEELLRLYEEEGLKTRIHEAYYRAAIEWNGVGNTTSAAKYALLSVLRGQVLAGPDRPFIENMKELLQKPEEHWTYKFRAKEAGNKEDNTATANHDSSTEKEELMTETGKASREKDEL